MGTVSVSRTDLEFYIVFNLGWKVQPNSSVHRAHHGLSFRCAMR